MKRLIALAALAIAASTPSVRAQWVQTAGPGGAMVASALAVGEESVVVIGTTFHRLDRSANRWIRTGTLPPGTQLYAAHGGERLLAVGDALLAQTRTGVIRSSDLGATWTATGREGFLMAGGDDAFLLSEGELLRSNRARWPWHSLGELPENGGPVVAFNGSLFMGSFYGGELRRSDDDGITWETYRPSFASGDATMGTLAELSVSGSSLFATINRTDVYRTRDGEEWERISEGFPEGMWIDGVVDVGGVDFAGTVNGLYRRSEGVWTKVLDGYVRGMSVADGRLVFSTVDDIFEVGATAEAPTSIRAGLVSTGVFALTTIGESVIASGYGGLHRTTDGGDSWSKVAEISVPGHGALFSSGSTLYAVAGHLYRSVDGGSTWETFGPEYDFEVEGGPFRSDLTGLAVDGTTLYAGIGSYSGDKSGGDVWSSGGVLRSDDGGTTWKSASTGLPISFYGVYAPVQSVVAVDGVILVSNAMGVYRSTSRGARWSPAMMGLPTGPEITRTEMWRYGSSVVLRAGSSLFISDDQGSSWRPLPPMPVPDLQWSGLAPSIVDGALIAVMYRMLGDTASEYRLMRFDGRAWSDMTAEQPEGVAFTSFVRLGDYVYAGSQSHGVWRQRVGSSTAAVEDGARAVDAAVVPNPARTRTSVSIAVSQPGPVRVSLIGSDGTVARVIDHGPLSVGEHWLELDVRGLPAGAYVLAATGVGRPHVARLVIAD